MPSPMMQVAIPSYQRPELIKTKTLEVLRRAGVPLEWITVWVADDAEADAYRAAFADPEFWLTPANVSISAAGGLCASRNAYWSRYPEGTWLVHMDDDVDELRERHNDKKHAPLADDALVPLWRELFATAAQFELRLWGIYPVVNAMFMAPTVTTDLRLITGPMYGTIVRHGDPEATEVHIPGAGEKEDRERTLRYYVADGGVVRCNYVAVKTRYYRPDGGIHAAGRSADTERAAVDYLLAQWPDLVTERPPRKAGFPEVRLADKRD